MVRGAAAFALLMLMAPCGRAAACRDIALTLPHPLRNGESAFVEVRLGVLGPGQEVDVTTSAGRALGTISPFAIRLGHPAGTYTLPLPVDAIDGDHVCVRLTVTRAGATSRPPTPREVLGVTLLLDGPGY